MPKITIQFSEEEIRMLDDIVAHDQTAAMSSSSEVSTLQSIRGKVRVALNRLDAMPHATARTCTCTGACRGAAGLAPGWVCALNSTKPGPGRDS